MEGKDTSAAMKSVQGIQARIDELIAREKEAIHEHYQMKLSKSKLSGMLEQSRLGQNKAYLDDFLTEA